MEQVIFVIIGRNYKQDLEFSITADAIYDTLVVKFGMVVYTLSGSTFKGSIIERVNRTLKTRIARYLTENNTTRWIDALPGITAAYNKSYHRSIKMTPNEADVLKVNFKTSDKCKNIFRIVLLFSIICIQDAK